MILTFIKEDYQQNQNTSKREAIERVFSVLGITQISELPDDREVVRDAVCNVIKSLEDQILSETNEVIKKELQYQCWFLKGYVPEKATSQEIEDRLRALPSTVDRQSKIDKALSDLRGRASRTMIERIYGGLYENES